MDSKKRILLTDDDPTYLGLLRQAFTHEGFDVVVAHDGEEGLQTALAEHPDLVISDVKMPKMDGMMLMKRLREDSWGATVPMIILTNLSPNDEATKQVMADAPSYYLLKADLDVAVLVEKVKQTLGIAK